MFLLIRGNCLKTFKGLPMCWPKSTLVEDSSFACLGDDMMSCLVTNRRFSRRFIVRAVTKVQLYSMGREGFMKKIYMASCDVLRRHMLRYVFWELFHDTLWYRKELIATQLDRYRRARTAAGDPAYTGIRTPRGSTHIKYQPTGLGRRSMAPSSGFSLLARQAESRRTVAAAEEDAAKRPPTQKGLSFRTGFRIAETPTMRNLRETMGLARTSSTSRCSDDDDEAGEEAEPAAPRGSLRRPLRPLSGTKPGPALPPIPSETPNGFSECNALAEDLQAAMYRCRDAVDAEVECFEGGGESDLTKMATLRRALLSTAAEATVALSDLDHIEEEIAAAAPAL